MAGLSSAWMLKREGFNVTVFEKGQCAGLAAHSRDFSPYFAGSDRPLQGDVPSRMFNVSLWPSVTDLYHDAGVDFEPVDNQQSFSRDGDVLIKIGLPYLPSAIKNVFNPNGRKLMASLSKFQTSGLESLRNGSANHQTFGQFVEQWKGSDSNQQFLNCFLFPALTSTVFTCPKSDLLNYPCEVVLDALRSITEGGSPLNRTVRGSAHAADLLLRDVDDIRSNTAVKSVSVCGDSATVQTSGETCEFEHVIVATQANHASRLVEDALPEDSDLLSKFRYVDVPIVVHTDASILPKRKSDWRTFNFKAHSNEASTCTVWMNRFHKGWPTGTDIFHSIFPEGAIDKSKVISSSVLQRPIVDSATERLHKSLQELHSHDRRVWFVGSYASPGVPLLESAVQSSLAVLERLTSLMARASA